MKSKVKFDFHTLYTFYSAVDHHHHRYCHNRCWSSPLSSYCSIIMLLLVIVATGITERVYGSDVFERRTETGS